LVANLPIHTESRGVERKFLIFLENVDNKAFLRITVLIWIHPLEMNASSRVLLGFRIATTVLTKHKLTPVTLFQKH